MSEGIKIKGTAIGICKYDDGRVVEVRQGNMIVTSGFDMLIKSITQSDGRPNVLSHIAIGSGDTPTTAEMTALVNETHRGVGRWTWSAGQKKFTITTAWNKGDITELVKEGGVFNASFGGEMFDRIVFETPIQGTADMQYTQKFEFEVK